MAGSMNDDPSPFKLPYTVLPPPVVAVAWLGHDDPPLPHAVATVASTTTTAINQPARNRCTRTRPPWARSMSEVTVRRGGCAAGWRR
jgi:hypothetical protein